MRTLLLCFTPLDRFRFVKFALRRSIRLESSVETTEMAIPVTTAAHRRCGTVIKVGISDVHDHAAGVIPSYPVRCARNHRY